VGREEGWFGAGGGGGRQEEFKDKNALRHSQRTCLFDGEKDRDHL